MSSFLPEIRGIRVVSRDFLIIAKYTEECMEVAHLGNATITRNMDVSKKEANTERRTPLTKKREAPVLSIDREKLKAALDKLIRNTRFQYVLKGELSYLAVRIIDRDTDKVIREIPSKELQKIHENVERALGILFDEII